MPQMVPETCLCLRRCAVVAAAFVNANAVDVLAFAAPTRDVIRYHDVNVGVKNHGGHGDMMMSMLVS